LLAELLSTALLQLAWHGHCSADHRTVRQNNMSFIIIYSLKGVIPVVCIRLMGRELQSVTQLSVSNRWYVLDQQNYMFQQIEAISTQ